MVTKQIEITHWPDTFEDFVKEYETGMTPHMLEDYLIFQAVEHYFPTKECRTCMYYHEHYDDYNIHYGLCKVGIVWDKLYGTVSPHFGCVDWRARE